MTLWQHGNTALQNFGQPNIDHKIYQKEGEWNVRTYHDICLYEIFPHWAKSSIIYEEGNKGTIGFGRKKITSKKRNLN